MAQTSSAIQIVDPRASKIPSPTESKSPGLSKRSIDQSQQRQCRNVLIFGSCRFEDKGCTFYHPPRNPSPEVKEDTSELPRVSSPISVQHLMAPVFVPKAPVPVANGTTSPERSSYSHNPILESTFDNLRLHDPVEPYIQERQHAFFQSPPNYHMYTKGAPPHPDPFSTQHGYFVSDDIRQEIQRRAQDIWAPNLSLLSQPEEVHVYHTIMQLGDFTGDRKKTFGNWTSIGYRATSSLDGNVYALRRIENYRLTREDAFAYMEPWTHLNHPNIVRVKEAFTTMAFGDSSLVIAYEYHPLAITLFDAHLKPQLDLHTGKPEPPDPVPEAMLWSYAIQISNAMKSVHDRGMSFRLIDASNILLTANSRIRINFGGVADMVLLDSRREVHQQEDMISFGRMLLSLCSRGLVNPLNYSKALDSLGRQYSPDLKSAVLFLLSPSGPHKVIGQVFDMIGSRLLMEMDAVQLRADSLESQLAAEIENGRLVRLLSKFGFINERPEYARDSRWSETGDRYIVKLFRDFIFHQVDENGRPVVNLSHVLMNLNKLDAGSEERIMLVSRDEQSCLVVSYQEIKRCIESAFRELV